MLNSSPVLRMHFYLRNMYILMIHQRRAPPSGIHKVLLSGNCVELKGRSPWTSARRASRRCQSSLLAILAPYTGNIVFCTLMSRPSRRLAERNCVRRSHAEDEICLSVHCKICNSPPPHYRTTDQPVSSRRYRKWCTEPRNCPLKVSEPRCQHTATPTASFRENRSKHR